MFALDHVEMEARDTTLTLINETTMNLLLAFVLMTAMQFGQQWEYKDGMRPSDGNIVTQTWESCGAMMRWQPLISIRPRPQDMMPLVKPLPPRIRMRGTHVK
jgi:hypothetical protein